MTPQISNASHTHALYDGASNALGLVQQTTAAGLNDYQMFGIRQPDKDFFIDAIRANLQQIKETKMADTKRRLIKVIIVDPDEKVPLEKCILYSGSEKLTDLTDQELFFEIDIKDCLYDHNESRKKIIDKSVKERTEFLEPIKVRDLRMVVVTIAQF